MGLVVVILVLCTACILDVSIHHQPTSAHSSVISLTAWLFALTPNRPVLNGNTTVSFLLTTDVDIGDLMIVKLRWEKDAIFSWADLWSSSRFHIRKLRIKSGETQSK